MFAFALYVLAGFAFVDFIGYAYHRFVEHAELLKLLPGNRVVKAISKRHAIHHLVLYPPENLRPEEAGYRTEDRLSWYLPGTAFTLLVFAVCPLTFFLPFALGGWSYGLSIDLIHRRFHAPRHWLVGSRAFQALQRVHDRHHVDQGSNFTIISPLLDWIGGTLAR